MTSELTVQTASRPDIALYPAGATFGPRTLSDYEFVWLLSGSAEWVINTERHALHPGVLSLARPGPADTYRWDARTNSTHAYVHFTFAPSNDMDDCNAWPRVRELTAVDPMAALCRHLLRLGAAPASPEVTGLIVEVLTLLVRLFLAEPLPAAQGWIPDAYTLRLTAHLRRAWAGGVLRPISVGELADAAGLSVGYLSRLVHRRLGVGPARAVELLRLGRAAGLLDRSNLPVAAVAAACGYEDAFHFSKRFHATYHVSPRAYRTEAPHEDRWAPVGSAGLLHLAHSVLLEEP
ncbi:MAG TPA: helix-turn-helix transcriptional regulator [Mycobacteriales bacterium]|nr:helix-turn-helix transcriptional regulator [Mycobacteriales bacterium]